MPNTPLAQQALRAAAELSASGQFDEAATALAAALSQDERQHEVRYELGLIEAQRGNFAVAETLAREAAASGGDAFARGLGYILAKSGKVEEAKRWLARALDLDSNDAWTHANLGAVYGDEQNLDEALACMDRALSIRPDFPWARFCRDRMLSQRNFLQAVRAVYAAFAAENGLAPDPDASGALDITIPSASRKADGTPRFSMAIPAHLVLKDLGAAHLFYREIAARGYEFALRRFLDLQLQPDDVFIDVGAHWGVHSLTAATRWPGQVSVLAIEAHPENSARLLEWVERNRLQDDVEVIAKAIADRDGTAHIRVNASTMGHSLAASGIEVPGTTLDKLLADRPSLRWRRILLKIDVEGYENEVLMGARQSFATREIAAVIWEKGDFHEQTVQQERTKGILDFLSAHGFEHFRFADENAGGDLVPLEAVEGSCNVYSLAPGIDRRLRYQ